MPFIPHTEEDIQAMLKTIGVSSIDQLFDEIPDTLPRMSLQGLSEGLSEMALKRLMQDRANSRVAELSFLGAGAYEHHIPALVFAIARRGEFYTAYTPYQAEASQGSLQLIYEYQTMMAGLMGLSVSNASLYDGASALAEAILMSVRLKPKQTNHEVLLPLSLHPLYRETVKTIVSQQGIILREVPYDLGSGIIDETALDACYNENTSTLVIPGPNFFGRLEKVDELTDWALERDLISVAVVNPIAMAFLKPPGQWGKTGVDIAVGEGQPLGIPLSAGGPYYGFLCAKSKHIRQMPGRIVGRTQDARGNQGFVLTMQAREQHIRRGKATSNICTNQGLMVTVSTIYMSVMGPHGLRQVAMQSHHMTQELCKRLLALDGIELVFQGPHFHEVAIRLQMPVDFVLAKLLECGIEGGLSLAPYYPELGNALLLCATETKTLQDIERFTNELAACLACEEACHVSV